jgi:hypothetical protein
MKSRKPVIIFSMVIVLMVAAGFSGRDPTLTLITPSKSVIQQKEEFIRKVLPLLTEQLNEKSPYMIDPSLRFDEAVTDSEALTVTYFNTFISLTSADTDFAFVDEHLPDAIDYVCNEVQIRKLMEFGVSYIYVYRGRDGVPVRKFIFSESDCNLLEEKTGQH